MKQYNRPILISITGGIASGKSIVSNWFEDKGYQVVYADKIGHQVLNEPQVINALTEMFGERILTDGIIDRSELGKIVFDDPEKLAYLNKVTHPVIRQKMQQLIDDSEEEFLFIEIPLLFESGLEEGFDLIINVSAKKAVQVERLKQRNNIDEVEADKKIASQLPDFVKQERADININNNSTLERLFAQLETIERYMEKFQRKEVKRLTEL